MVMVMVMMTMCRKSGAGTEDNHGEQNSFFHGPILATAGAVTIILLGYTRPSR
jgi:hypothetical protein